MNYAKNGSLKKNLSDIIKDEWIIKLMKLESIINGLDIIHQQKMVHCDFHHGNILNTNSKNILSISDLGLCRPINNSYSDFKKNDIYGVLPFVAPEVLRGKPYTPASDIYSFSIIMWEFTSGIPPFNDRAHDFQLCYNICKGERPKIIENTPQCYIDLMKKCWNEDPLKRPDGLNIKNTINNWYISIVNGISEEARNNALEFYKADKVLKKEQIDISDMSDMTNHKSHPQAYHTSRLLNFTKKLNDILDQEEHIETGMFYFTFFYYLIYYLHIF